MKKLLFLLLLPLQLCALELCLPVNITSKPKINLCVEPPEHYTSLQPLEALLDQSSYILEFVPAGQTGEDWTEIVTIVQYTGLGLSAKYSTNQLKYNIPAVTDSFEILKEQTAKFDDYHYSTLAISYDLDGDHQLLVARYYSGPYDQAGIQYTIRTPTSQTDPQTLKKINTWLDEHTHLVDF